MHFLSVQHFVHCVVQSSRILIYDALNANLESSLVSQISILLDLDSIYLSRRRRLADETNSD